MESATSLHQELCLREIKNRPLILVSRNVVDFFAMLTSILPARLVLAILDALQGDIRFVEDWNSIGETEVKIPVGIITSRHQLSEVMASIKPLTEVMVRYTYAVPGVVGETATRIISSIEKRNGAYFVRIPGASLPWYLYCGQAVGFVTAYSEVFDSIESVHELRLYLGILHFVDAKSHKGVARFTLDELRRLLGLPENTTMQRITSRYVIPLNNKLRSCLKSPIWFCYEVIRAKTGYKGRPHVTGLVIYVSPREKEECPDIYEVVLFILNRFYEKMRRSTRCNKRPLPEVVRDIIDTGQGELFVNKVTRAEEGLAARRGGDVRKQTPYEMSNIVARIIEFDLGIRLLEKPMLVK